MLQSTMRLYGVGAVMKNMGICFFVKEMTAKLNGFTWNALGCCLAQDFHGFARTVKVSFCLSSLQQFICFQSKLPAKASMESLHLL